MAEHKNHLAGHLPAPPHALLRTLQPLVNDTADKNFEQAAMFLRQLSRAAERDPDYMDRLSRKLTNVSESDRQRFAELTLQAAERAARLTIRKASHTSEADETSEEETAHMSPSRPAMQPRP